MKRVCFPCIYHTHGNLYQVHFPDFPEACIEVNAQVCAGSADTILAAAHDYLETHIYGLAAKQRPLPRPTPFGSVPVPIRGKKTLLRLYLPDQPSAFLAVNKWLASAHISWREAVCIFSRGSDYTWETIRLPDGRWYGWIDDPVTGEIYSSFTAAVQELIDLYAQEYGWPLALAERGETVFHDGGCPLCGSSELLSTANDGWGRIKLECVFDQCRHRRLVTAAGFQPAADGNRAAADGSRIAATSCQSSCEPPGGCRPEQLYALWRSGLLPYPKRYVHYYNETMLQAFEM